MGDDVELVDESDDTDMASIEQSNQNTTGSYKWERVPLVNSKLLLLIKYISVKHKRTSWSELEKIAVRQSFGDHIDSGIALIYEEYHKTSCNYSCLQKRTPPRIKSFVTYQTKKSSDTNSKGNFRSRISIK